MKASEDTGTILVFFDGCAGPHLGTETISQYWAKSVDTKTKLLPKWLLATDAKLYAGLTGVR